MAWGQHCAEEWDLIQHDATNGGRLLRVGRWDRSVLLRRGTAGEAPSPGGGCGSGGRDAAKKLAWHMEPVLLVTAEAAAKGVKALAEAWEENLVAHSNLTMVCKVLTALLSQARPVPASLPFRIRASLRLLAIGSTPPYRAGLCVESRCCSPLSREAHLNRGRTVLELRANPHAHHLQPAKECMCTAQMSAPSSATCGSPHCFPAVFLFSAPLKRCRWSSDGFIIPSLQARVMGAISGGLPGGLQCDILGALAAFLKLCTASSPFLVPQLKCLVALLPRGQLTARLSGSGGPTHLAQKCRTVKSPGAGSLFYAAVPPPAHCLERPAGAGMMEQPASSALWWLLSLRAPGAEAAVQDFKEELIPVLIFAANCVLYPDETLRAFGNPFGRKAKKFLQECRLALVVRALTPAAPIAAAVHATCWKCEQVKSRCNCFLTVSMTSTTQAYVAGLLTTSAQSAFSFNAFCQVKFRT